MIASHDVLEALKQALLASRDVIISLDGGNSALAIGGFSRDQFWGLKSTLFKGISEPHRLP